MTAFVDEIIRLKKRVLVQAANGVFYVGDGFTCDTIHGALLITLVNTRLLTRLNGFDAMLKEAAKEPDPNACVHLPGHVTVVAHAVYEVPTNPKPTG